MRSRDPTVPDSVRRFVLPRVPSVPFLEAARVCHSDPAVVRTVQSISSALYVSKAEAKKLLIELEAAGAANRRQSVLLKGREQSPDLPQRSAAFSWTQSSHD